MHVRGDDRFGLKPPWALLYKRTNEAIAARRAERQDDLISYLLDAEMDGRKFTDTELYELCFTMVIGGMATTARLTLGGLSYFATHRDQRERVRQDRSLLPDAIEEFLRYYSPVPFLSRTATKDVCLGGQDIKAGDRVVLGYAAANRDPKVFEEPNEIRIDRSPNRHLALGQGAAFLHRRHARQDGGGHHDPAGARPAADYALADFDRTGAPPRRPATGPASGSAPRGTCGPTAACRSTSRLVRGSARTVGFEEFNEMPAVLRRSPTR